MLTVPLYGCASGSNLGLLATFSGTAWIDGRAGWESAAVASVDAGSVERGTASPAAGAIDAIASAPVYGGGTCSISSAPAAGSIVFMAAFVLIASDEAIGVIVIGESEPNQDLIDCIADCNRLGELLSAEGAAAGSAA